MEELIKYMNIHDSRTNLKEPRLIENYRDNIWSENFRENM